MMHKIWNAYKTQKNKALTLGVGLLVLTGVLQLAARKIDGFATWYSQGIYRGLVGIIGRIAGIVPVSVVEFGLYLLICGWIVSLIRILWKRSWSAVRRFGSRTVCLIGVLAFVYTCNCGINYYAQPFSAYAGIETGLYSRDQLYALCEMLVEQVNENVTAESYRGDDGSVSHKQEWKQETVAAMKNLGTQFPALGGFYPLPKEVTVSYILSVQQLCGVYSPFTIEANFNGDMPNYNIPHTMCHELSHLKGFMREDEANFIGYLACVGSDNQAFRYSGYLTGWVYAGNALARVDMDAYVELSDRLSLQAKIDLQQNNEFWDRYEGKVAEASTKMNDTYLKANSQTDGVKSYGRMVDLMLAYYELQCK
jgi:hypothetical protein